MKGLLQALTKHKKRTVAIVHNTVAPYRHVLFEELSRYLDLRVYYCSLKHSSRKWDLWLRTYDYEYKILSGLLLKTPVGQLSVNLSVVKELFLNRPYALLLGGYENATMWLAFAVGMLLRIPVVVWTEGMREPQSILGAVTKPLRILFFKKSNAVVVPGRLSGNYVISLRVDAEKVIALSRIEAEQYRYMGVPEKKIEGIPNGIDLSEYTNLPPKGSLKRKFKA